MESRIVNTWNTDYNIQQSPVFVSVKILTKNVKVSINNREVACKLICDERARGAKREPRK